MFILLAVVPANPYLEPASIIAYVAIGIAIIGTIIMWRQLHYGKRRQYKELTYSKFVDTPLISVDTRAEREKIQIFYNKREVTDTYLALLKIRNSGTEDVRIYRHGEQPVDTFETPYWFVFEGRTVLARSVQDTDPPGFIEKEDLEAYNQTTDPRTNAVSLPHCLLKAKRAFTLRILLTGPAGEIKTEGQLVGCELKEDKPRNEARNIPFALQWRLAILALILFTFINFVLGTPTSFAAIVILVIGLIINLNLETWFKSM